MTPFQCDLCHFRNLHHRDPKVGEEKDRNSLEYIRHANINAFWSRETSTVTSNLSQAQKMEKIGTDFFGFASVTPAMEPFPLEDVFGMKAAMVLLKQSLDSGKNEKYLQFSSAPKIRSAFSNAYHASKELEQISAMAHQSTKTYATTCPTYGY